MTMANDQNNRPRFLQSAKGQVTLLIVAAIAVVFLSMVLHGETLHHACWPGPLHTTIAEFRFELLPKGDCCK
jgi:hypothetical protein